MRKVLASLLVVSFLVATVRTGRAADPPAPGPISPEQRAAAKAHYERGETLYESGSYTEAIGEYEQAFALMPSPYFLFNIAQSYRLSGDKAKAVAHYRRYLDADPEGPGAEEARAQIVTLTREIEAERPADAPRPAEPEPRPDLTNAPAPVDVMLGARPLGAWQWGGISMGVGGLAAAGVATYFTVRARELDRDVSAAIDAHEPWSKELTDKYNEGVRDKKLSIGLFIGAGLLVGGGVSAFLFGPRPEAPRIRIAPSVGSGSVGFLLDASF